MKFINETLTFLFELFMLASIFMLSVAIVSPLFAALVLAIACALAVMVVWGLFLAPRAKKRPGKTAGLLITTLLTAFGPLAFWYLHPGALALAIIAIFIINRTLAIAWRQW